MIGVDAAPAMLAVCRRRFPGMAWLERDMRNLGLGRRFDAIIAWNSFFHLAEEGQRALFPIFTRHIASGGLLLFTADPAAGITVGEIYGRKLFHASLAGGEYRRLLTAQGFEVLLHRIEDPQCGYHTVWLARYAATEAAIAGLAVTTRASELPNEFANSHDLDTLLAQRDHAV